MNSLSDEKIIDSWHKNAAPWTSAVRNNEIESRKLVTNTAILNTIKTLPGSTILDIGCGEGWLANELSGLGLKVMGFDVVPELINSAKQGQGNFKVLAYEDFSNKTIPEIYDIAVCNFSLLGKESVEHLFKSISSVLKSKGRLVIQTIHPENFEVTAQQDAWLKGSWDGFSEAFSDPAPWYSRTLESWKSLFSSSGFNTIQIVEPTFPDNGKKASLIIVAQLQ